MGVTTRVTSSFASAILAGLPDQRATLHLPQVKGGRVDFTMHASRTRSPYSCRVKYANAEEIRFAPIVGGRLSLREVVMEMDDTMYVIRLDYGGTELWEGDTVTFEPGSLRLEIEVE